MTVPTTTRRRRLTLFEQPAFGDPTWIAIARVEDGLPDDRPICRAARVTVHRTPLYQLVGEPDPINVDEQVDVPDDSEDDLASWTVGQRLHADATLIEHDRLKFAPYTDLVRVRGEYFLVEV